MEEEGINVALCSLTLEETTGTFSPNVQNQHKVFLKLCGLLDSPFEADSLQAKNITQLLIRCIDKQTGNSSFQLLIAAGLVAGKVVISSVSKLIANIQLILTLSVQ